MFLTVNGGGAGLRFAITTSGDGAEQQLTGGGQLPGEHLDARRGHPHRHHRHALRQRRAGGDEHQHDAAPVQPRQHHAELDRPLAVPRPVPQRHRRRLPDLQPRAVRRRRRGLAGGQAGAGNVASYKFDEAGGATALDSSGNSRNATISGSGTAASASTPLWQPLPDGPIITIPAGSTNVPVTSTRIQGRREAGDRLRRQVRDGDRDRDRQAGHAGLPVGRGGPRRDQHQGHLHRQHHASVTRSGSTSTTRSRPSPSPRSARPARAAPASPWPRRCSSTTRPTCRSATGAPASPSARRRASPTRATSPCRRSAAASRLDQPLDRSHAIDEPVSRRASRPRATRAPAPNQWFGGPALSTIAGSMALRDAAGLVADSLNYGNPGRPVARRGLPGAGRAPGSGCTVAAPGTSPVQRARPLPGRHRHRQQLHGLHYLHQSLAGRPTSANSDESLPVPTVVGGRRGRALRSDGTRAAVLASRVTVSPTSESAVARDRDSPGA